MNNAKLKAYAPQARRDFIAAVTAQAAVYGLGPDHAEPLQQQGDVVLIGGRAFPGRVAGQRCKLEARIVRDGFERVMEGIAYTWFNRCAALRYLEHGYRVLSPAPHPDGGRGAGSIPEILEQAEHVDLPGLKRDTVIELKLDGTREAELYRLLLVAQCNALSAAMPFLFERIDDETELLLPDNLLRTDSVITQLVGAIPEEDWADIEIIGWLYQFYISEKKDQVIGKVVKSEDIPAATQLFTPNWIVQYLVQNSIGRLWLMANPASSLKSQWPYYIEPAEQTPEVQAQLDALIQTRMDEDGGSLNPESITCLDPACGSGHILVEAYEVLKGIYLERGYRLRDIPRLILEKNLYGLDIDDRAAQLAGFALLMKARADDRRLLDNPPKLNVLSLQDSKKVASDQWSVISDDTSLATSHSSLITDFEHAKTFGSLIQIPKVLEDGLAGLEDGIAKGIESGDVFAKAAAQDLVPLVQQAKILAMKFDAVVANPPYMGGKYLTPLLKKFLKDNYGGFEKDLFSAFMIRDLSLAKLSGQLGFMSPFVWMFISSYEDLRSHFIENATLTSLIQLEYSGFDGATVPICTFTLGNLHVAKFVGSYVRLSDFKGADKQGPKTLEAIQDKGCGWFYTVKPDDFKKIPGTPVAYWIKNALFDVYKNTNQLYLSTISDGQNITADNNRFVRFFWEVSDKDVGLSNKWVFYAKGGAFRRWYGNMENVVDWSEEARLFYRQNSSARIIPEYLWFKEGITWSLITSSRNSFRLLPANSTFDKGGSSVFPKEEWMLFPILGFLNSPVCEYLIDIFSCTLNLQVDEVRRLPFEPSKWKSTEVSRNVNKLIEISIKDDHCFETSHGFGSINWISGCLKDSNLYRSWLLWSEHTANIINEALGLQKINNELFINAYGLQGDLSPEVPESQITLSRPDREKDTQRLTSYAIGCMMGRYSLDEPGLIYAHAGNIGFDATRYKTFPADTDGIIPITDELWFEDDAANRIREFILAVWPAPTFEENMAWLAESLGTKGNETPDETIRRYLASRFFKDHLQTYKKRPIYWLFSSGKQGAFQALVYLHRYHEGTLARMRTEYVIPLQGRMASRIEQLDGDVAAATSTAHAKQLQKQRDKLAKQRSELLAFDEKLRHYADQRITLDLDDGVKVNYGKFGDLLAEVKAVTGGKEDS